MAKEGKLPRWLELANPMIVALQRRGMVIGTMRPRCPVFRVEEAGP